MPTGFHIALNRDEAKELFSRRDPDSLCQWLDDDLLPRIDSLPHHRTEDWELMHRVLGDGTLSPDGGEYPLNHCYLGSRPLDAGDRTVRVIRPDSVGHLAMALAEFKAETVAESLESLPADYSGSRDDDTAALVQDHLGALQRFFHDAASEQSAVLFVVV